MCADCGYGEIESSNEKLLPLLLNVTQFAYFRYFKVNLFCDCPLWPDDSMCALEACSVCECDDHEVPQAWMVDDEEYCQTRCASTFLAATMEPASRLGRHKVSYLALLIWQEISGGPRSCQQAAWPRKGPLQG